MSNKHKILSLSCETLGDELSRVSIRQSIKIKKFGKK